MYGGVAEEEEGPVARKLATYPFLSLVFGAWNEASPDVHELVHTIAKARLRKEEMLEGWGGRRSRMTEEGALAVLTGQVRRSLSLVAARATSRCLLDRLEVLGSGDRAAQRRRSWREKEVRAMDREQRAHALSVQYGMRVLRRGEFYLQ